MIFALAVATVVYLVGRTVSGLLERLVDAAEERNDIARSALAPLLSYTRSHPVPAARVADLAALVEDIDDPGVVLVSVRNDGPGPAIIDEVSYDLRTRDGDELHCGQIAGVADFLHKLFAAVADRDYLLVALSRGATIGPGRTERFAALTMPLARQLDLFTVSLTYHGGADTDMFRSKTVTIVNSETPGQQWALQRAPGTVSR